MQVVREEVVEDKREAKADVVNQSDVSFELFTDQMEEGSLKYGHLLRDEDVSLWYRQLKRGSEDTADNYLKRLGRFCEENRTTPKSYLTLPKKQREDRLMRYIDNLSTILNPATQEPYAPSYVGTYVKAVQSWAKFCGKKLERVPKVHNQDSTPTLKDERTFLQEEFGKFLYAPSTTTRVRVSIILMALAGARPGTQGNKRGTDGLLVGDLPDLEIVTDDLGKREVKFKNIPARLVVRASISKCRHEYFTFICQEGCTILKAYLDKRLDCREKLSKDSALIVALPDERAHVRYLNRGYEQKKFLSTSSIRRSIREALRKSGISMRPYVLRSYFDTQLMLAESKGLIIKDYRQFFMGHKGDIERRYTLAKRNLPEPVLQSLRESYSKASIYLETKISPGGANLDKLYEFEANTKALILKLAGFSEGEISKGRYLELTPKEFLDLVNERVKETGQLPSRAQQSAVVEGEWDRRVVTEEEAEKLIEEGWEPFLTFSNGKIAIRKRRIS